MRATYLTPGEPAPEFVCRAPANDQYRFSTVAGRYVVLCFYGSAADAAGRELLDGFFAAPELFDDEHACFFGVSSDPDDERLARVAQRMPGLRFFWDFDRAVAAGFGLVAKDGAYRRATYVFDTRLRVLAVIPFGGDARAHGAQVLAILKQLPPHALPRPAGLQAPVLVVPHVFEPGFCRELIATYDRQGGGDSGFMRQVGGRTVGKIDHGFKRRRDCAIEDERQLRACRVRLRDRLIPEIAKAFQFRATKVERYIVSCYDASEGGFFRAHRDNQTPATRHRRFAVSLFLNTGEYEGGFLQFAEFGRHLYSAPAGGAVVFSCSLLHEATPVTRGKRYMFLPFLF